MTREQRGSAMRLKRDRVTSQRALMSWAVEIRKLWSSTCVWLSDGSLHRHELEVCNIYRMRKYRGQTDRFAPSEVNRCSPGVVHHPTSGVATPVKRNRGFSPNIKIMVTPLWFCKSVRNICFHSPSMVGLLQQRQEAADRQPGMRTRRSRPTNPEILAPNLESQGVPFYCSNFQTAKVPPRKCDCERTVFEVEPTCRQR